MIKRTIGKNDQNNDEKNDEEKKKEGYMAEILEFKLKLKNLLCPSCLVIKSKLAELPLLPSH